MKILLIFSILVSYTSYSQTISKQVIAAAGTSVNNGTNKLSYTVGELLAGAMASDDGALQLGNGYFPSLSLETLSIETPEAHLNLKVFPNPVTEAFYISHPTAAQFKLHITAINGQLLYSGTHQKGKPFSMQPYGAGVYLITVTTLENNQSNIYKIIKK
jgi:hypothetical protein